MERIDWRTVTHSFHCRCAADPSGPAHASVCGLNDVSSLTFWYMCCVYGCNPVAHRCAYICKSPCLGMPVFKMFYTAFYMHASTFCTLFLVLCGSPEKTYRSRRLGCAIVITLPIQESGAWLYIDETYMPYISYSQPYACWFLSNHVLPFRQRTRACALAPVAVGLPIYLADVSKWQARRRAWHIWDAVHYQAGSSVLSASAVALRRKYFPSAAAAVVTVIIVTITPTRPQRTQSCTQCSECRGLFVVENSVFLLLLSSSFPLVGHWWWRIWQRQRACARVLYPEARAFVATLPATITHTTTTYYSALRGVHKTEIYERAPFGRKT